jgi:acyl-CoA synthetase (AMP-forming)/AMP-acid ligase II
MMLSRPTPVTAQSLVAAGLRRGGRSTAVIDPRRTLTFAALDERTARLANAFLGLGAGPRRPVAVLVGNRVEYVEVDVAATRAGVPRVGLSDRLSEDEWAHILEDSCAAVLVATPELLERLGDPPAPVEAVLVVGEERGGTLPLRGVPYEHALTSASASFISPAIDAENANYILYTSGTTGRPKGAWHSHGARAAATLNMLAFELNAGTRSVMAHVGPVTHGSGSKILPFLAVGAANLLLDRFDVQRLVDAIERHGATHTFMVPTMLQRLLDIDEEGAASIRKLEQISFGGAPIAPSLYRAARERFGPLFVQVYGSCEAPHPVTCLKLDDDTELTDELAASAGHLSPAVEARVVGPEREPLAAGEAGELELRGAHLMSGYWNNAEATSAVLSDDGWYQSGDVASLSADGLVTFHDRKRDIIITGGLNVYPSEVERVLLAHPSVQQVAVVGYPDDEWGESIVAYVVPQDGNALSPHELGDWVKSRLAGYKKPRRYEFRTELPMGSSHKVLRQQLRDELWQGQQRRIN